MLIKTTTTLRRNLPVFFRLHTRCMSSSAQNDQQQGLEKKEEVVLPPEPDHCCMSGCPNCVWIKYAQELAEKFDNGDVLAKQKISEKVKDPTLRAFLFTTLGLHETGVKSKRT